MKFPILLGLLIIGSTFAADAPRQSASMTAAQNIRGQVGVMVAEVEDALGRDESVLTALEVLQSDITTASKTIAGLGDRIAALTDNQRLRVNAMTAKHRALSEELEAIDRIIAKLETEVSR